MSLSSISNAIKNRMDSPVLGNYVLSLLLLNWRIPTALLTGEISPEKRVALVEEYMKGGWYIGSFFIALGATLFYLYAVPLIELYIKKIQIGISIHVFQENNELDSRLKNENKYGVNIDSLGTALRQQLLYSTQILTDLQFTIQTGAFSSTKSEKLEQLQAKSKEAVLLLKDNNEIISALKGLFENSNNGKPVEMVKASLQNRENTKNAKK